MGQYSKELRSPRDGSAQPAVMITTSHNNPKSSLKGAIRKANTRVNYSSSSQKKQPLKASNTSTPNNGMIKINFVKDAREAKNILEKNRRLTDANPANLN